MTRSPRAFPDPCIPASAYTAGRNAARIVLEELDAHRLAGLDPPDTLRLHEAARRVSLILDSIAKGKHT